MSLAYTSELGTPDIAVLHAYYHNISENKEKNYDLIMIDTGLDGDSLDWVEENVTKYVKDIFGKITLFHLKTQEERTIERSDIIKNGDKREFRIILTESLPHIDMLAIHKMLGHDFCTITGDQSLSEAISRGCPFYYVMPYHKQELFRHLTNEIPGLAEAHINMKKYYTIEGEDFKNAATSIYRDREKFIQFCENIRNHKNLESNILNNLQSQHLSSTLPSLSLNVV